MARVVWVEVVVLRRRVYVHAVPTKGEETTLTIAIAASIVVLGHFPSRLLPSYGTCVDVEILCEHRAYSLRTLNREEIRWHFDVFLNLTARSSLIIARESLNFALHLTRFLRCLSIQKFGHIHRDARLRDTDIGKITES